ncbi:hypothetical protein SAMN05428985_11032 [Nocardioides sp. YR527]|uniref:hypothetical protein n=1 Tax=Nocardioides sp. YR527 TaxID=1881028 RepID=UPI00087DF80A|nr:hypothetical protein [Nocardioides sp. YR527]SDL14351.1 hypothetical protein SAMN05428985_11032 [Nocardioides sp. YR527]
MTEHDDTTPDFDLDDPFGLEDDEPTVDLVPEDDEDDEDDHTDFDAWWKKQAKAKKKPATTTIRGVTITLPRSLPLQYQLEVTRQGKLKPDKQNPLILASILLGQQQTQQLLRAGLDLDQFPVLLAWIPAKIQGSDMTLDEVARDLEEYERKRAEKRAQGDESGEA